MTVDDSKCLVQEEEAMKRAVWYAGSDTKLRMDEADTTYTGAIRFLKNYNNVSRTENGAMGYRTTAKELPGQVLIISDMEFDEASAPDYRYSFRGRKADWAPADEALFTTIRKQYEAAGYRMPRLILWNVCGRSDTIPMVDNAEGLCPLLGFSQNAMKIAAQKKRKDPWEALKKVLDSPRYQPIEEMWRQMKPVSAPAG